MKHPVHIYSPAAPDFGGFNGRFARVWVTYHAAPSTRFGASAVMVLGAVAGLVIAGLV
jgi:hypothetical protein